MGNYTHISECEFEVMLAECAFTSKTAWWQCVKIIKGTDWDPVRKKSETKTKYPLQLKMKNKC